MPQLERICVPIEGAENGSFGMGVGGIKILVTMKIGHEVAIQKMAVKRPISLLQE